MLMVISCALHCVHVLPAWRLDNNRRVQAEGWRALRSVESKVDKVDAEDVLSMLLRPRLPYPQPRLLVRGWCQSHRSKAASQHCS